jgi:hypothetical protein
MCIYSQTWHGCKHLFIHTYIYNDIASKNPSFQPRPFLLLVPLRRANFLTHLFRNGLQVQPVSQASGRENIVIETGHFFLSRILIFVGKHIYTYV